MSENNEKTPDPLAFPDPGETFRIVQAEWGEEVTVGTSGIGAVKVTRPLNGQAEMALGPVGCVAIALHDRIAVLEAKIAELEAQQ